jgi:hypothetical protein
MNAGPARLPRPQRLPQHFGLAVFEEKLATVGAFEATGKIAAGLVAVESGMREAAGEVMGGVRYSRWPLGEDVQPGAARADIAGKDRSTC